MQEGDADVDLSGLSVWISCHDAFAERLEASHLGFDTTSDVVTAPPFPECSAEVLGGTQYLVAGPGCRAVLLPQSSVSPDRNDSLGFALDDGRAAPAGIVGTVCGHRADLIVLGDLVQQIGKDRAVAVTAGR